MVANAALKQQDALLVDENEIIEKEIKWCSVSLSDVLNFGKRLEATVYDVEVKNAQLLIKNCKWEKKNLIGVNGFVDIAHYGGRLKRMYIDGNDSNSIGFIGSAEMLDVKPAPVKFMADNKKIDELRVKKGTVLISRSGTIGNLTIVNDTLSKLLVSEHAIRLECKELPGYVYTYLKSKVGQSIIKSKIYGAVIKQIEPEHLADIPVPCPSYPIMEKINDLVMRSFELRDESNIQIDTAMKMLKEELCLPPIQELNVIKYDNNATVDNFCVKLSEVSGRIDASYHVPNVKAITEHLEKHAAEVTDINDKRISKNIILPGRFKRVYVDEGHGRVFFGGKQLFELDPSNKKYLSLVHHGKRIIEQLELKENMVLITCSGTIGKVALVPKHWENWTANQHIIRVVPASIDIAGYLSIFLSSDYGYNLIKRYTYGSVVDEIDDKHVSQVPIPLLKNEKIQNKINDLALEANSKRYEAYQLEQKAIRIMDKEVIYAK